MRIPLKRNGNADEIAGRSFLMIHESRNIYACVIGTVIYLSSRAGAYVTGQRLDVEGGSMLIANGFQKITP